MPYRILHLPTSQFIVEAVVTNLMNEKVAKRWLVIPGLINTKSHVSSVYSEREVRDTRTFKWRWQAKTYLTKLLCHCYTPDDGDWVKPIYLYREEFEIQKI